MCVAGDAPGAVVFTEYSNTNAPLRAPLAHRLRHSRCHLPRELHISTLYSYGCTGTCTVQPYAKLRDA